MQSVYFLPVECRVAAGEELSLTVCHDAYSLWYSLQSQRYNSSDASTTKSNKYEHSVPHLTSVCPCVNVSSQQESPSDQAPPSRPCCTCQAHLVWTRSRFGEINDRQRTESYVSALRSVSDFPPESSVSKSTSVWSFIGCCAASRFCERTAYVLVSVMGVCFLCLLICLEPSGYSAMSKWKHNTHTKPTLTSLLSSLSFCVCRCLVWKTPE